MSSYGSYGQVMDMRAVSAAKAQGGQVYGGYGAGKGVPEVAVQAKPVGKKTAVPSLPAPVENPKQKIWEGVTAAASYIPWYGWFALGVAAAYGSPFAYKYVKNKVGGKLAKAVSAVSGGE